MRPTPSKRDAPTGRTAKYTRLVVPSRRYQRASVSPPGPVATNGWARPGAVVRSSVVAAAKSPPGGRLPARMAPGRVDPPSSHATTASPSGPTATSGESEPAAPTAIGSPNSAPGGRTAAKTRSPCPPPGSVPSMVRASTTSPFAPASAFSSSVKASAGKPVRGTSCTGPKLPPGGRSAQETRSVVAGASCVHAATVAPFGTCASTRLRVAPPAGGGGASVCGGPKSGAPGGRTEASTPPASTNASTSLPSAAIAAAGLDGFAPAGTGAAGVQVAASAGAGHAATSG